MVTYTHPSPSAVSETSATSSLKLTCKQQDLARALSVVKSAVLEHSTIPILKHILVSTDQGRLRVSATTLELGIQCWIDAQIEQAGTTALPAGILTKIVATLPQEVMMLSIKEGSQTLHLACPGTSTHIRGVDPREFPVIPGIEGAQDEPPLIIDAGQLKTMIGQVAFAADTEIAKPVLTAVLMRADKGTLTLAAANEFRLAERVAPVPDAVATAAYVLIPARNLNELARILPSQGPVQVQVTPKRNQVVFHVEQGERIDVVSRLIEGRYPNYQQIIPKGHTTRAVVDTKQFAAALERATLFALDKTKSVRLTLAGPGDGVLFGTLTVDADDADIGDHVSTIQAEVSGPRQLIYFHARYLAEALHHIDTPQVALQVMAQGRPGVLKPVSDVAYTSLVMSMATKQEVEVSAG